MNNQPDNTQSTSQTPQDLQNLRQGRPTQDLSSSPVLGLQDDQRPQISKECYSFEIETPQQKTFYFKLDEKRHPIKLGDGTYGIVFEVYDSRNQEYAAKLLYQDQETERSQKRFLYEMESSQKIRDLIRSLSGDPNIFAGVVDTEGGSSHFHSSPAYSTLQDILAPLGVSNYVLVMPKYERTLKQLLEEERTDLLTLTASSSAVVSVFPTGIPIGSQEKLISQIHEQVEQMTSITSDEEKKEMKKELREAIHPISGYEALRRMDFESRITAMQPYIYDVAQGLKTLHQVKLLHLDLKPANIFVRRKGRKIETVIADLGFLDEANRETLDAPHKPYLLQEERPSLPLGTRHYRSPEQKDFFDVADVEVVISSTGIELIVKDPKFGDTIIEDGDVVSFSKYKKEYKISEVTTKKLGDNTLFYITLKEEPGKGRHEIQQDKRTQVYFYKRQRHRTDLFGFGALVFELLTCGKSPERFYDAIRGYDTPEQNIDSIMDLYRQISNFQATEPGLVQIFSPFKLNDTSSIYAPPEIVKLILKCMLYKAESTFYSRQEEEREPGFTMNRVISELDDLYFNPNHPFETSELATRNKLYQIDSQEAQSSQSSSDFSRDLVILKQLSKQDFPRRLIKGIQYFEKLIQMVQKFASNEITYFFELLPKNITQDQSGFGPRYAVYESGRRYLEDLKKDFLYTKINRDPGNPYVPASFNFIRRTVHLKDVKGNSSQPPDLATCLNNRLNVPVTPLESAVVKAQKPSTLYCAHYEFLDASPYDDRIRQGDWLLIKAKGNFYLWQVSSVRGESRQLQLSIPPEEEDWKEYENTFRMMEEEEMEAIFYKDLSPTMYYLNMLGIYIYHLFFVGLDSNSHDKPPLENAIRSFGVSLIEKVRIENLEKQNDKQTTTDFCTKPKSRNRLFFGRPKNSNPELPLAVPNLKEEQLSQIVLSLAEIYLRLVFVESQDSYFSKRNRSLEECLIDVKEALYKLKREIADFLNVEVVRLDNTNFHREKELPQLTPEFGVELDQVSFSFNRLIGSLLRVPLHPDEAYLKEIFQGRN